MSKAPFKSPIAEIHWAFITQGRLNTLNGKKELSIDVIADADTAAPFIEQIHEFWDDNKPKGAKPKSLGYKVLEDGRVKFTAKTSAEYPSGDPKVIRIFNAKGEEVTMPKGIRIGNGSRGRFGGTMAIYDGGVAARGVAIYLDSVQLTKLIRHVDGPLFTQAEDTDGEDFTGFTEDTVDSDIPF